jgi:hypothetical protein
VVVVLEALPVVVALETDVVVAEDVVVAAVVVVAVVDGADVLVVLVMGPQLRPTSIPGVPEKAAPCVAW